MGSTSRANGGVRAQFFTRVNVEFSQFTIRALAVLDAATAGLVGLRRIGYLLMTGDAARAVALAHAVDLQRALGVPVEWLSTGGVHRLAPFVRRDGLLAATFCATDGAIDPHGVVRALCEQGRHLGVTYLFDTVVRGIDDASGHAVVRCDRIDVEADFVVNAAGAWARDVAALGGVDLPVLPYRRNLACTEPIGEISAAIPMCVDLDTGVLIRAEAGGVLIAYSDASSAPTLETQFDPLFLDDIALRVANRFPFLQDATIDTRKCWAGSYPETPDHHAIIDVAASAPWFIQCAGFGGHGIMHSLAAGQAVTELVRDQRCTTFDLEPLRLARFAESDFVVERAVF